MVFGSKQVNTYVGPHYHRTEVYAARVSRSAAAAIDRYLLPAPNLSSKPHVSEVISLICSCVEWDIKRYSIDQSTRRPPLPC